MRAIAAEKNNGTEELLFTSALSSFEIIVGKYLGILSLVVLLSVISLFFPLTLVVFSDPEVGPILSGALALILFSAALSSLALFVSSLSESQTVSAVLSTVVIIILYISDAYASFLGGLAEDFLRYVSPAVHSEMMQRGVILGSDLMYFISLLVLGLFLSVRVIDTKRSR